MWCPPWIDGEERKLSRVGILWPEGLLVVSFFLFFSLHFRFFCWVFLGRFGPVCVVDFFFWHAVELFGLAFLCNLGVFHIFLSVSSGFVEFFQFEVRRFFGRGYIDLT